MAIYPASIYEQKPSFGWDKVDRYSQQVIAPFLLPYYMSEFVEGVCPGHIFHVVKMIQILYNVLQGNTKSLPLYNR